MNQVRGAAELIRFILSHYTTVKSYITMSYIYYILDLQTHRLRIPCRSRTTPPPTHTGTAPTGTLTDASTTGYTMSIRTVVENPITPDKFYQASPLPLRYISVTKWCPSACGVKRMRTVSSTSESKVRPTMSPVSISKRMYPQPLPSRWQVNSPPRSYP